jgi:MSHA biogenesis protein MshL
MGILPPQLRRSRTKRASFALMVAISLCLGAAPGIGQEQPQEPPISDPDQLPPLAVTQLEERRRSSDLDDERTFSLAIGEPMPVRELLMLLLRDTEFSLVLDPDVEGTFTGDLKNVTLRQALELVLHPLGLDYAVQDNTIRVFRRRMDTRIFDLELPATRRIVERVSSSGTEVGNGAPQGTHTTIRTIDDVDPLEELTQGIQTLLSPGAKFNVDRKASLLQITDFPDRLDRVSLYLAAVQARTERQVDIQAQVLETGWPCSGTSTTRGSPWCSRSRRQRRRSWPYGSRTSSH